MVRRRGFTLIELLVSVSIMAVLMSLLLPQLRGAREKANRIKCQSNLRSINQAIWHYSVRENGSVPYVETPMTNGGAMPGFGIASAGDEQLDPFDRTKWPRSLPNLLLEDYLGGAEELFACPSAVAGWPRSGPFRFTYRDSGVNQLSGVPSAAGSYIRENFGFLDGRPLELLPTRFTGNPVEDGQIFAKSRSTYLRDMVLRQGNTVLGPHDGGVNVITRQFGIEYRDRKATLEDLAPRNGGVMF